jgi:hypothetical protein
MKVLNGFLAAAIALGAGSLASAGEPPFWPCESNDGAPFGHLADSDVNELVSFAAAKGLDLVPTVEKVYTGDKDALAAVMRFSTQLKSRNTPMRVYGNMVYSIYLNLGESKGEELFIAVLQSQNPAVRQRILEFLWYPVFCVPEAGRAEAGWLQRASLPTLWPPDFVFGKDDSLFSKTPKTRSTRRTPPSRRLGYRAR